VVLVLLAVVITANYRSSPAGTVWGLADPSPAVAFCRNHFPVDAKVKTGLEAAR
jgi:hypothetical protein